MPTYFDKLNHNLKRLICEYIPAYDLGLVDFTCLRACGFLFLHDKPRIVKDKTKYIPSPGHICMWCGINRGLYRMDILIPEISQVYIAFKACLVHLKKVTDILDRGCNVCKYANIVGLNHKHAQRYGGFHQITKGTLVRLIINDY